jgi:adenine-specific DNA-methyltransferase
MKISDLNEALVGLGQHPSREKVLTLAFDLLQWMGIQEVAEQKPVLLPPQTQKLREYLAPAPITSQPQLYRLSTDNTPVRVRFAVLKKLKKEYIGQLVDNDPGLTSYQAISKGLNQQPSYGGFIPSQPYFVHLVTTADYDRLVLIFNQGDQKRIVSFRNRLTNTQYHKIVSLWQGIASKSKPEIADLFWKSLDIKEVNKEFYKQIKERFDALLATIKLQQPSASDSQTKQFAVRLIGRYVFCWFLKEKKIIPDELISSSSAKAANEFYQKTLLKLFFETLNRKVQDRDPLINTGFFERIPYLNGGLFDQSDEDRLFAQLDLDAWLIPFIEVLESFDFTVDESSSQYQQVAVDPEMLGRIFENLLASQNEETEKLANQRKAFGAFYTPREIVDYMVSESLKAYLQTNWENAVAPSPEPALAASAKANVKKAIDTLFLPGADGNQLKKEERAMLLGFLEKVKILDPACGSGAFPMGVLHKLVDLHEILGTVKSGYELKKDILSHNIYGVDIMPMAIEIARLRAWLSLVLEEEYKPNDFKHNFGVKPLPNFDFKFVCANTLIDSGYDDFLAKLDIAVEGSSLHKLASEIQRLEAIRDDYFDTLGDIGKRERLKEEFGAVKAKIKSDEFKSLRRNWGLDPFFEKIDDWNPFDDSYASSFFSPGWMFGRALKDGFDVVIGNPPYLRIQSLGHEQKKLFALNYRAATKNYDVYVLFDERGLGLLKVGGSLIYIQPSKFFNADYGIGIRKLISEERFLREIVDFKAEQMFETATTYTCILHLNKFPQAQFKYVSFDGLQSTETYLASLSASSSLGGEPLVLNEGDFSEKNWTFGTKSATDVFEKMDQHGQKLKEYCRSIFVGLQTNSDPIFILKKNEDGYFSKHLGRNVELESAILKPILKGAEIRRYGIDYRQLFLIFPYQLLDGKAILISEDRFKSTYPKTWKYLLECEDRLRDRENGKMNHSGWYGYVYPKNLDQFQYPKIMTQVLSCQSSMVYDPSDGYYFVGGGNAGGYGITLKIDPPIGYWYLLALLNSRLIDFYIKGHSTPFQGNYFSYSKRFLSDVPIRKSNKNSHAKIEAIAKLIQEKRKNGLDSLGLEQELDNIIYKLYALTYDEVIVVDPAFPLSEAEYLALEAEIA